MKLLILILFLSQISVSYAGKLKEIEGHIGMVSVNFSEIASNLSGPNTSDPASGSFSVIASSFAYHFYKYQQYSVYVGGIVPMLSNQGVGYLSTFIGGEYFFNELPHMVHDSSPKVSIYLQPKLRYHLNSELSVNYLTYATESAKKTDISFGLGIGGGGSYTFSKKWAAKLKVMGSKDIGLITDSFALKFFFGGIFYLDL